MIHTYYRLAIQTAYLSETPGGASMTSEAPHDDPADVVFSITPQDANVLQHYLDQFREGDTPARTLLIDRVMGELYRSRPENSSFDMQDVKQV